MKTLKKMCALLMAALTVTTMTVTAVADEPYNSYNYDFWGDTVPSQNSYTASKSVTGKEMNLSRLSDPEDPLFVSEDASDSIKSAADMYVDDDNHEFWIADTDNNRILRLDKDLKIIGRYYGVSGENKTNIDEKTGLSNFSAPEGIFVKKSLLTGDLMMYVADTKNSRVIKAKVTSPTECEFVQDYVKPDASNYGSETFQPSKVVVDNAENIYTVVSSINTGAVQYSRDGSFTGFYGANRVAATAEIAMEKFMRLFKTKDQIEASQSYTPVEFKNFDMDDDGFIYTVTEASTDTDAVKKLNPAGYNIWDNDVGHEYVFGDVEGVTEELVSSVNFNTKLTDIAVSNNGMINLLDYETGRIFQYDRLCNLICIFGNKNSASQRGSFSAPNAIEALDNNVYVIDGIKNDITVFTETTFGNSVHEAFLLYDDGKYLEAKPYWEKVIEQDGGYTFAYTGLGKAALKEDDYSTALKYFKFSYDNDDYNKAFQYARENYLRDNFTKIVIIVVVIIAAWILIKKLIRKLKLNKTPKTNKEGK